jgi:hypothetical protein
MIITTGKKNNYVDTKRHRQCVDCGIGIGRKSKWRCKACDIEHRKSLTLELNPQYKGENASVVAINRAIIKKYGHAKRCDNANCMKKTRQYRWARLKARSGRRGGIWIMLCRSCLVILSSVYHCSGKGGNDASSIRSAT